MSTYLRGALIEFAPALVIPIPNVIIFQYNPETMTHTWTQPQAIPPDRPGQSGSPLAVKGSPGEAFSFTLAMDANDPIADDTLGASLAKASGIYSRIAALEMLIQPADSKAAELVGSVSAGAAGGGPPRKVPAKKLPVVLFVWGPGRIVPVRVTTLTFTEQRYDKLLNPIHAEAQVGLQVLTPEDLDPESGIVAEIAKAANSYTSGLRQALAIANVVNVIESIVGMIPH